MISDLDLAYVAGLLDGEGCITIAKSKPRKATYSGQWWLQVGISNTDKEIIDWLHSNFNGHISDTSSKSRVENGLSKQCWAWRTTTQHASSFLETLLPYLRIKKEQAVLAIQFQAELAKPRSDGVSLSQAEIVLRDEYKTRLAELKR